MNLQSVSAKIAQKQKEEQYLDYALIGDAIKKKRLEVNDTQALVAKGVCSISYLSKVENNKMVPSAQVVKKLSERLDIDVEGLMPKSQGNQLLVLCLKYFFYEDFDALLNLEEAINNTHHHVLIEVYSLMSHVVNNQRVEAERLMNDLELRVMSMEDDLLQFYLLVSAYLLDELGAYDKALTALRTLSMFNFFMPYVEVLKHSLMGRVYGRFGCCVEADLSFRKALELMQHENSVMRKADLQLTAYLTLSACGSMSAKRYLNDCHEVNIPHRLAAKHAHVKALLAIEGKIVLNWQTYLSKFIYNTRDVYSYRNALLLLSHGCEDTGSLLKVRALFENPDAKAYALQEFVDYTLLNITEADEEKQYIKDVAYPLAVKSFDVKRMEAYTNKLMAIVSENARYKEALSYHNRFLKHKKSFLNSVEITA